MPSTSPTKPDPIRRISVLTRSHPEDTAAAMRELFAIAAQAGVPVLVPQDETQKHGFDSAAAAAGDSGAEVVINADPADIPDLCVVLGGDGTVLRALRKYAGRKVPVFGINFGRIGFLATAERAELESSVKQALAGEFDVLRLPALTLVRADGEWRAFNDVGVHRKPDGQVAELAFSLGGNEVTRVRCDGLIAATPAGSTGYNLANGGPILAWGVEGYVVSFISPHTLTARPLVVAPQDVLHVRNRAGRDTLDITVDGGHVGELPPGGEIEIGFRDDVGLLAQLPGTNFYDRFREKFGRLSE